MYMCVCVGILHRVNRKPGDTATVEDGLPAKYAVADHLDASFRSHVGAYRVSSAVMFII